MRSARRGFLLPVLLAWVVVVAAVSCKDDNPFQCWDSCTGCCEGERCIKTTAQKTEQCGVGGNVCGACQNGQTCEAGSCQGTPASDSGIPPDAGTPGDDAGVTLRAVGGPCATTEQCAGNGEKTCITQNGHDWVSGYCSQNCATDMCPTSSSCALVDTDLGTRRCLEDCTFNGGQSTCRAGYVCDKYATLDKTNPAQAACVSSCQTKQDCPGAPLGCDAQGFCCGAEKFRCCETGMPCGTGLTCTDGYCLKP